MDIRRSRPCPKRSARGYNPIQCVAHYTSLGQGCTLDLPRRFALDPTGCMSPFSYGRCNICATERSKLSTIHPGRSLTPAPLRKVLPLQSVKELRPLNTALINYSYENGPVSDSAGNCIFWNQICLHFHILMQICTEYVKMIYV